MKNYLLLFLSIILLYSFSVSLNAEDASIELRAFKDGKFIKDFSEKDFKIFANGSKGEISSISFISGNKESKVFGKIKGKKDLNRNFVLIFSARNLSTKILKAIDHFFQNVILPGDSLTIFTPKKTYNLKSSVLKKMPKQQIAGQLKNLLNRDIKVANQIYMSLLNNLIKIVKETSINSGESSDTSVEMALPRFREDLIAIDNLRHKHQKQIIDLILATGKKKGQNPIYFFYDREFVPSPTMKDIRNYKMIYKGRQDVINIISSLFEFYKRDSIFEKKKLKKKLNKLNLIINSIFFKEDLIAKSNSNMVEHSEDIFDLSTFLSKETGGKMDVSSNLLKAFKSALEYSNSSFIVNFRMEKSKSLTRDSIKIKSIDPGVSIYFRLIKN